MRKDGTRGEHRRRVLGVALVAGVAASAAAPATIQGQTETLRFQGSRVEIYNLAGRMEVVRGSGPELVVEVSRRGRDAERLELVRREAGGVEALVARYPADRVVYGGGDEGSMSTVRVEDDGSFGHGGGGRRITVRGSGEGLEAWADLRVLVPPGSALDARVAVGDVTAADLEADLRLQTGSGDVEVRGARGVLLVDTGSGDVSLSDVEGEVGVDTGSGSVHVERVQGPRVSVDTGSGEVEGRGVRAGTVRVDTGSGSIRLADLGSSDVVLDTGSGGVDLRLLQDVERLEVDTGSGSVTVRLPDDVGAEVEIGTGSGGIDVDFPMEGARRERSGLEGRIGDGRGRIHIDTGSGSVRIGRLSR